MRKLEADKLVNLDPFPLILDQQIPCPKRDSYIGKIKHLMANRGRGAYTIFIGFVSTGFGVPINFFKILKSKWIG